MESSFEFPVSEDVDLLKGMKSLKEIKKFLYYLKNSADYQKYNISYVFREWAKSKLQKTTKHFAIYFTCCDGKVQKRPSIHFISTDGQTFQLSDRSTYAHNHFQSHLPWRRNILIKQDQDISELNSSQKSWIQDQQKVINSGHTPSISEPDIQQSSQKSDSWEQKQKLEKTIRNSHKIKRLFTFPTNNLLQKIQTITSITSLNNKISHFIMLKNYWLMQIRHREKVYYQEGPNGEKMTFLMIQFTCCQKQLRQQPFLRFIEKGSGVFQLYDYNIHHDHRGLRGRKKRIICKKEEHSFKREAELKENSIKNTEASQKSFIEIILNDAQLMSNVNQYSSSKDLIPSQSQESQKMDEIIYALQQMDEQNQYPGKCETIKQESTQKYFVEENLSESMQIDTYFNDYRHNNLLSTFHKKFKVKQKVVIQISSQSDHEPEQENRNQNLLSNHQYERVPQKSSQSNKNKKIKQEKQLNCIRTTKRNHKKMATNDLQKKDSQIQKSSPQCQQKFSKLEIYSWLQRLNEQLTKFIREKHPVRKILKDSIFEETKKIFQEYFKSQKKLNHSQNQQNLNICIVKMLLWNKIKPKQLQNLKTVQSQINPYNLKNKIFFNKIKKNQRKYQFNQLNSQKPQQNIQNDVEKYEEVENFQVLIGLYDIEIGRKSKKLKILIAYTLVKEYRPCLLWFYILNEEERQLNLSNFSKQDLRKIIYFEVLNEGIKYHRLQRVNFIFTSFDCQLMDAIEKICQYYKDSQKQISSTMHISCIEQIMKIRQISQNCLLAEKISSKIGDPANKKNLKNSCKELIKILNKDIQKEKSQTILNPRIIYEHYKNLAELFQTKHLESSPQFSMTNLSYLISSLINKEKEKYLIDDCVQNLNSIFRDYNKFNHVSEFFTLIVRFFDSSLQKNHDLKTKNQIVPSYLIETQNQIRNFYYILGQKIELTYSIQYILGQPSFQMSLILKKYPRFIIQTIYRLIIVANQLAQKNHKKQQKFDKHLYVYLDLQEPQKKFLVIPNENKTIKKYFIKQDRLKISQSLEIIQIEKKKWKCSCNFYSQTGIPCQHEILTALQNKHSLFKQINYWKIKKH